MLLQLAIFVPVLDLDDILNETRVSDFEGAAGSLQLATEANAKGPTHTENQALLDQAWELPQATTLIFAGATAPKHTGLFIGGDIDSLEGHPVGAQDGLEP